MKVFVVLCLDLGQVNGCWHGTVGAQGSFRKALFQMPQPRQGQSNRNARALEGHRQEDEGEMVQRDFRRGC